MRGGTPEGSEDSPARETREREAAWQRGREAEKGKRRDPEFGAASPDLMHQAFSALCENVRDYAIFLVNSDGVITYWGEGARLIKWWTKAEAEGAHLRLLYPDGGSEDGTAEAHLRQAAEEGEYTGEGRRVRSDGSIFWAGLTLTALRDPDGELIGFVKVTRDLTARRAADDTLRSAVENAERARGEAEEANRVKSQFLATMSHEIRTPINAVMGYADLLEMEIPGPVTDEQREQLKRIKASNRHLLGIIDEVLEFSRLDADRTSVDRQVGWLGEPVADALRMLERQAKEKGVTVADAVSGFAAELPFWGDESRVRQITVILLSNAVKFTPSGGRITVSAGTSQQAPQDAHLEGPGPWVFVRVEDTGPGIPEDRRREIFEPFQQADMSLTRQHGGTGLGLTIAKRLAELMQGGLHVRSEPGAGSTFFLWLPAAPEEVLGKELSDGEPMDSPPPKLLQEVHDAILIEIERILHGYVSRLRSDPEMKSAHDLSAEALEDHLATFLSDLAGTFSALDLAAGAESEALRDSSDIRRTIAERHGLQRRRFGWDEAEVRREFVILQEEVAAAIERQLKGKRDEEMEGVLRAVKTFIEASEQASLESFRAAAG